MSKKNRVVRGAADQTVDAEFEERVRRVMKQIESKVRESLSHGVRPLHEIELDVDKVGDAIKEAITKEVIDQAGDGYCGTRAECLCGSAASSFGTAPAKFRGYRSRRILTLHGWIRFSRAYYHCGCCRSGFCPTDRALDLDTPDCSRTVRAYMARLASYMPFADAAQELRLLRRIRVSPSTVRRHAQDVGNRIGRDWDAVAEQVGCGTAASSGREPRRLFESMDAAKCHVGGEWRDVKLAAAYERSEDGLIARAQYYASLECSHDFGPRLATLAHVAGADACHDRQVIGDGAEWIWKEASKHDPTALQTLDFYHLSEHLEQFAKVRFGEHTPAGRAWMERQTGLLLSDGFASVLQDISQWRPAAESGKVIQRKTADYMTKHASRMNYGTLRGEGYDIGSGLIESGCKNVIKTRMGGAGMRWEQPGATAVLHLSAFWKSDHERTFIHYA